jgi:hypothetical protein
MSFRINKSNRLASSVPDPKEQQKNSVSMGVPKKGADEKIPRGSAIRQVSKARSDFY